MLLTTFDSYENEYCQVLDQKLNEDIIEGGIDGKIEGIQIEGIINSIIERIIESIIEGRIENHNWGCKPSLHANPRNDFQLVIIIVTSWGARALHINP